jgi:hypothetical protein
VEDRGVTAVVVTSQHLVNLTPLRAQLALTKPQVKGQGRAKSADTGPLEIMDGRPAHRPAADR